MNFDPDDSEREPLTPKVAHMMQLMRQFYGYLITRDVDARPFIKACQVIIDADQGRAMSQEATDAALKTFHEFLDRLKALPDFPPQWSEEETKQWFAAGELLSFDLGTAELAEGMKDSRSAPFVPELNAMRDRIFEMLRRGENPREEFENLHLSLTAEMGEVRRRRDFTTAVMNIYWESMPQEKWDELTPEARGQLTDMLAQWRGEFREELLGSLPLEDRRRLEAMEQFTPEEWDRAGKEGKFKP
jgi:hypothetical protein